MTYPIIDLGTKDTIIIIRHGKPALSRKVWLTWRGYRNWWHDYDRVGLATEQTIPTKLQTLVKTYTRAPQVDLIISSPLPRAVESAQYLFDRKPDIIDPDLCEAVLPSPCLGPLKLRPIVWGTISRMAWYVGWSDGMETRTQARARAETMCDKLDDYTNEGKTVFIMAHGWFNRMLKGSLLKRDWKCVSQNGELYWNFRRFERHINRRT